MRYFFSGALAVAADLETLRAVGPVTVALEVLLGAGEAVLGRTAGGSSSPALAVNV